eukprot:695268-Rhodomonas_salina.1
MPQGRPSAGRGCWQTSLLGTKIEVLVPHSRWSSGVMSGLRAPLAGSGTCSMRKPCMFWSVALSATSAVVPTGTSTTVPAGSVRLSQMGERLSPGTLNWFDSTATSLARKMSV